MKRSTFSVLFFVKSSKKLKDGNLPIYARITVNGKRAEFGLQKSVKQGQWDPKKERAKGNSLQSKELNACLDIVLTNLHIAKRELEEDRDRLITVDRLKDAYLGVGVDQMMVVQLFKDHNEKCKQLVNIDFAPGTVVKYHHCCKHVEAFIKTRYRKPDLYFCEINAMFIKDFESYLKTEVGCNHNTAIKYVVNFKKIVRIALANGWIKSNPFATIKLRQKEVDIDYLDEVELKKLMAKKIDVERLDQVKDVYLFCCFTGLAFIDVKSLCTKDLVVKDTQFWIRKKRHKTKNWCEVPLLKPAINILEKYKLHPLSIQKGLLLPVLTNQKMNAYLKEIADLCGIKKHLSTHTARHTFATTVTLGNQVSIEVVSKMLGHSTINMTKRYARVVDDLIKRDMEKIIKKFDVVGSN